MTGFPPELEETYEFERVLGKGAMGSVFQARERKLGRSVAIKVLLDPSRSGLAARLEREAQVMARLEHRNLPRVYELGRTREGPWLAMELIEGASLEKGVLPEGDALEVMLQVGAALDVVHAADLVHRDVKPANILRETGGRVLLMDLGLALDPDRTRLTQTGLVGTPLFMAPELLRGSGGPTPASDWYAWGMTLHFLLEGRGPISNDEFMGKIADPDGGWFTPVWRRTDPGSPVARVVARCLAEDPAARPRGLAAVEALLEEDGGEAAGEVTRGLPRVTSGSSHGISVAGPPPRRRVPTLLVAAVLAVAFGYGIMERAPPPASPDGGGALVPAEAPPGPADEVTRLPADFPARVRADLEEARARVVTRDRRVLAASRAAEEDLPLLDPDPIRWDVVIAEVPAFRRYLDWVRAGGDPAAVPGPTRRELAALDRQLEEEELEPVFYPFLDLAPRAGTYRWGEYARGRLGRHTEGLVFEGWAATAAAALEEALLVIRRLDEEFEGSPRGPVAGGEVIALGGLIGMADADDYLSGIANDREIRIRIKRWIRAGVRPQRAFFHAAFRAVEGLADTDKRDHLGTTFAAAAAHLGALCFSGAAAMDPRDLMGGEPRTPAGWLLAGEIARKNTTRLEAMQGDGIADRADQVRACFMNAMVPARKGGAFFRYQRAANRLIEYAIRFRDPETFREVFETIRPALTANGLFIFPDEFRDVIYHVTGEGVDDVTDADRELVRTSGAALQAYLDAERPDSKSTKRLRRALEHLRKWTAAR